MPIKDIVYNEVFAEVFTITSNTQEEENAKLKARGKMNEKKKDFSVVADATMNLMQDYKIVMLGLFHQRDEFHKMENFLVEQGLFVSRFLTKLNIDIKLRQDFMEIYNQAWSYQHYDDKLFGPQEEELGEDNLNPLKFAKAMRQKKKELLDNAGSVQEANREELKKVSY